MTNIKAGLLTLILLFSILGPLKAIEVSVTTLNYFQDKPYLEIYSRILGNSVQFTSDDSIDSLIHSEIELLLVIKKEESIVSADKYKLSSPASKLPIDFWDMKRYVLDNGEYDLEMVFVDMNRTTDTLRYNSIILVNHSEHYISNSDILITKEISGDLSKYPFNRSGFSYEPAAYNLFAKEDNLLTFYTELYHLNFIDRRIYYRYSVRDAASDEILMKPAYKQVKDSSDLFVLETFDISELATGNYELNFEIINKEKQVLHQEIEAFSVYHPLVDIRNTMKGDALYETSFVHLLDEGEVNYSLKAIFPRVNNNMTGMLNDIIWSDELEPKRYFLYSFWSKFSTDQVKPIYDKYMDVARAVDMEFANNVGHGFESDRGYMFLKYGKPDDVVRVEDEPSAPPYEIWIYNYLEETQQTGVKFLFYNPSIVANDFILLHSNCRGELSNPKWEFELYRDDQQNANSSSLERTNADDGFNRNARRYFTDY